MSNETAVRPARRIAGALLALALVIGLAPSAGVASAYADASAAKTIDVVLTIADASGTGVTVIKNEHLKESSTSTVADLLKDCGLTETKDEAVFAKDHSTYTVSSGYPSFCGKTWEADYSAYWKCLLDDTSDMTGATAVTATLKNGAHYKYVYGGSETDCTYKGLKAEDLLSADSFGQSLLSRFKADSSMDELDEDYVMPALTLGALNGHVDIMELVTDYATRGREMSAGKLAKVILGLSAGGVDCTKVCINDQDPVNLVEVMEDKASQTTLDAYSLVWILPVHCAYDTGWDKIEEMTGKLIAAQSENGEFGGYGYTDIQTTAQAACALSLVKSSHTIAQAAYDKALAAIKKAQCADGGFALSSSDTSTGNIDTTGAALAALATNSQDANIANEQGNTPLLYLINQASTDGKSFPNAPYSETLSAATAVMGICALHSAEANNQPFDIYAEALDGNKSPYEFHVDADIASKADVALSQTSYTYTGKAQTPALTVTTGKGNFVVKLTEGTDYTVSYANNVKAGKATVTITGKGVWAGSVTKSFTIAKASQKLTVKTAAKTVKAAKAKKKARTVKAIAKVTGAKTELSYKKAGGAAKLSVNAKTGKITVKKGTKKGTYKAKIKVTAKTGANYKAASKTVTVKVKVK